MPLAGLILNRVQRLPAAHLSAARSLAAAEVLQSASHESPVLTGGALASQEAPEQSARVLAIAALRLHADRMELAAVQRRAAEHFTAAHPLVPVAEIPAQPEDVHDLDGLRLIGQAFGPAPTAER
jgi:hypothetical protein